MLKFSKAVLSAVVLLALISPLAAQQSRQDLDGIVALVEEDVILRSELDMAVGAITQQVQSRGEAMPPRSIFEEQVLERLVLDKLQEQHARATGIRVSDSDVDQMLQQVAQQNGITVPQLRATLEADGYDFSEFRSEIRDELLRNRLQQRLMESMDDVTETEVEILLASERFGGGEYKLSQILIGVPETATPLEVEQAREQAARVVRELEGGLDFASAAISYSQAPDALEGGDVGWRNVNMIPTVLADALGALEVGGHTDPIRTPIGFLIIRLDDKRDSREVMVQEYSARHIQISTSELVDEQTALRRAEDLYQQLMDGADFAPLARAHSDDDTTANLGGMLNWFPRDAYGPQIQGILENLEPGQISRPFQMGPSWHVLKLEDVRVADRTEDTIRHEARSMLRERKAEEEYQRFLRRLRDESFVEMRLE